jgi:hypothetical protein
MNVIRLAAVGLAVLLVTAGLTAATPAAPAEHRTTNAPGVAPDRDASDGGTSDDSVGPAGAAGPVDASNRADAAGGPERGDAERDETRGPPSDLPAAVPDHVAAIHDTIRSFLSGVLDGSLGRAVSGVAGDGAAKGVPAGG